MSCFHSKVFMQKPESGSAVHCTATAVSTDCRAVGRAKFLHQCQMLNAFLYSLAACGISSLFFFSFLFTLHLTKELYAAGVISSTDSQNESANQKRFHFLNFCFSRVCRKSPISIRTSHDVPQPDRKHFVNDVI